MNGFAVVLPQILAGLLSVVVVYHLVRRSFGTAAGLLAAWAFIKATDSGRLHFLLLGLP